MILELNQFSDSALFVLRLVVAALLLSFIMIGAIYFKMVRWHVPFAAMDKTGWEFDLILLATNIFILINGGGAIAIQ